MKLCSFKFFKINLLYNQSRATLVVFVFLGFWRNPLC